MSIYSAFIVLGTVLSMEGPLPYNLHECQERAGITEWRLDLMFQTPDSMKQIRRAYPGIKREQVQTVCVEVKPPKK